MNTPEDSDAFGSEAIDIEALCRELDESTPATPTRELPCEPFGRLEVEFSGDTNQFTCEEEALLEWITSNWPSLWPALRDRLVSTIDGYAYGKTLEQLLHEDSHGLAVRLTPKGTYSGADWSLDLVIPLPSGSHAFYVDMKREAILQSGASF